MPVLIAVFCTALFLNGATDASNTVTGAISSGSLCTPASLCLAAIFEIAGVIISYIFFPRVAGTVSSLASFGDAGSPAVFGVCLGVVALWAAAAWVFGMPTSESHGLMAAMCGCGAALGCPIDAKACASVIIGLFLSVAMAGAFSALFTPVLAPIKKNFKLQKTMCICFLAASAFLHGAQDGQKFLALLSFAAPISSGTAVMICAVLMGCGTVCGGTRIVNKMGTELTHTDLYTSCCADAASSAALFILSAFGCPVSTTHVRMTALSASARASGKIIDKKIMRELVLAWITTFPFCYISAYLLIKLLDFWGFC